MSEATQSVPEVRRGVLEPITVGRYRRAEEIRLLPVSAQEMERATHAQSRRIASFHFRSGDHMLVTALYDEAAQFTPTELALREFGLVLCSADASPFDAARTESILRRFEVAAVMGVNAALVDGLEGLGHDPTRLFAGPVVWARPDAYARLQKVPGLKLRRWIEIGPAVAIECAFGTGAHIDALEWQVEEEDGEILLTNRLNRALDFSRYHTGIKARVERGSCRCGSADPRVVP